MGFFEKSNKTIITEYLGMLIPSLQWGRGREDNRNEADSNDTLKTINSHYSHLNELIDQCVLKEEEDWGLVISACDAVNASDNGAKEAVKFIKKKLSKQQPSNVQYRALSILRAMADNCGAKFHAEIASKKFLDELELVAISTQTDPLVRQKLIEVLGDLSVMFENEPSLWQVSYLFGRLAGVSVKRQSNAIDPQQYSNPTRTTP
ncbi:17025_t:CDS:2, partial [Acaulospora morrowiae]